MHQKTAKGNDAVRFLYYAPAYNASHGGRNHAREFVHAAENHPAVQAIRIFPSADGYKGEEEKGRSRSMGRRFIENSSFAVAPRLYRLRNLYFPALMEQLHTEMPQVLHFRHGPHFLQLLRLRRLCPNLILSVEVNASPFDETFEHARPKSLYRRLEAYVLRQCDFRFYVSGPLRTRIMETLDDTSRDIVVPNGVDVARCRRRRSHEEAKTALGIPSGSRVIGYVGGMDTFRRLDILLDAYAALLPKYPNTVLVFAGDGEDAELLRRKSAGLGLTIGRQVIFTGWLPRDQVPRVMEAFDLGIQNNALPYMSPQKLFEYMAMKLPVIGPQVDSVSELFVHGKHLLLVENDAASIQKALETLFEDAALTQAIAHAGHEYVCEKFTWAQNASAIIDPWRQLIESKGV